MKKGRKRKGKVNKGYLSLASYGIIFIGYLILLNIIIPIVSNILQLNSMMPINYNAVAIYTLVVIFIASNLLMYVYEVRIHEKNYLQKYIRDTAEIIIREQIIMFFYINNIIIFFLLLYNFSFNLFFYVNATDVKSFVNQDLAPLFNLGIIIGGFIIYKNNDANWVVRKVIINKLKMFGLDRLEDGGESVKEQIIKEQFEITKNVLRGMEVYKPRTKKKKKRYSYFYYEIYMNNVMKSYQADFKLDYNERDSLFKSKILGDYCYDPSLISNPENYIMFMQINFNNIVSTEDLMPKSGILQIFLSKHKNIQEAEIKAVYNEDSETNMREYSIGDNIYYDYLQYSYVMEIDEIYEPIKGTDYRFNDVLRVLKKKLIVFNDNEFKFFYDKSVSDHSAFIPSNMLCYINTLNLNISKGEVVLFQLETLRYKNGINLVEVGKDKKIYVLIQEEDLRRRDFSKLRIQICD